MARTLATGTSVCVTVTLLDGLVLARSGFHHSANYRSAVVLGKARLLVDHDAKLAALETISEHIVPGRWAEVRAPSAKELRATSILELPIDEASAKIREGGPLDEETDYDRDVWAGVLPLELIARTPVADARRTLTPLLRFDRGDTLLVLIDLANGKRRLGGSEHVAEGDRLTWPVCPSSSIPNTNTKRQFGHISSRCQPKSVGAIEPVGTT